MLKWNLNYEVGVANYTELKNEYGLYLRGSGALTGLIEYFLVIDTDTIYVLIIVVVLNNKN